MCVDCNYWVEVGALEQENKWCYSLFLFGTKLQETKGDRRKK